MEEQKKVSWGWPPNLGKFTGSLWSRYSMTGERYRNLLKEQNGTCPGCDCELANPYAKMLKEGPKPHVDYWQDETKEPFQYGPVCRAEDVRGLLCGDCKHWLKQMNGETIRIKKLLAYLETQGDKHGRR